MRQPRLEMVMMAHLVVMAVRAKTYVTKICLAILQRCHRTGIWQGLEQCKVHGCACGLLLCGLHSFRLSVKAALENVVSSSNSSFLVWTHVCIQISPCLRFETEALAGCRNSSQIQLFFFLAEVGSFEPVMPHIALHCDFVWEAMLFRISFEV
jgi:hypothetical protein